MINGLQIIVNLPLFYIPDFPDLSQIIIKGLIAIATFDVMPTDYAFEYWLDAPDDERDDEDDKFVDIGIEANYLILNLGTVFFIILILVAFPVLLIMTRPCRSCSKKFKSKHEGASKSFRGNAFFTFILEGFLDIGICATLNILWLNDTSQRIRWDTSFDFFNSLCLVVLTLAIAIFPIFFIVFYLYNFKRWKNKSFKDKYGAVLEGLKKDSRWSVLYPIIFIFRRLCLIWVVTIGRKNLFLQITSLVIFSAIQVAYLATYKPKKQPLLLKLDIFNEVTTVILVDSLTVFSEGNAERSLDRNFDYFLLFCLFGNLSVHLFFLIKNVVRSLRLKILKCWRKGKFCCCRFKEKIKKGPRIDNNKSKEDQILPYHHAI